MIMEYNPHNGISLYSTRAARCSDTSTDRTRTTTASPPPPTTRSRPHWRETRQPAAAAIRHGGVNEAGLTAQGRRNLAECSIHDPPVFISRSKLRIN
jgi:hypothetical protein